MEKFGHIAPAVQEQTENEKFYEREIALVLGKVSDMCKAQGLPLVAVVEIDPGVSSVIGWLPAAGASISMALLTECASNGEDFDGFVRKVLGFMDSNGIDYSASKALVALAQLDLETGQALADTSTQH